MFYDPWEREEDQLCNDLNAGLITREEYNKQMREISRDRHAAAQEAAQDAYDREMDRW